MNFFINMPAFIPDTRGNKLSAYEVRDAKNGNGQVLVVCCSDETAAQITALGAGICTEAELKDEAKKKWTHGYRFPGGVPAWFPDVLDLLSESVTLIERPGINMGMSVDWYHQPDEEGNLVRTDMGRRIAFTKHAPYPNGSGSRQAWRELIEAMVEFINRHPIYATTNFVTSPPGHKADGKSFGEQLARAVARAAGKTYIEMTAPGPRPEQKEAEERELSGEFTLTETISERIIIIDDVFHTGATLDAAMKAARRAGATEVITLTAARALRK